jgi:hypothetical protein
VLQELNYGNILQRIAATKLPFVIKQGPPKLFCSLNPKITSLYQKKIPSRNDYDKIACTCRLLSFFGQIEEEIL